ncbi:hypothetical protein LAUMK22_03237 [Mycobacterium kansasii]|uniref:Uncharacterized protein n=1 Tax=Mycobacterium kansasii TaxID=1768 RepID=A0A653F7M3_MYCKA|nr:hypothetical protein MKANGN_35800 [Mycobacterium kansasii]VAZ61426.1 hypothetical protein LAUMK22_03237 [Mycobacterium kansasii]VAZ67744.1 hypothetical protein LAUMK40_03885 [Mycobacterium kansasii]VTP05698.1 hypothetical protein BIN_B_05543 [Mycobacterium kansasii]
MRNSTTRVKSQSLPGVDIELRRNSIARQRIILDDLRFGASVDDVDDDVGRVGHDVVDRGALL